MKLLFSKQQLHSPYLNLSEFRWCQIEVKKKILAKSYNLNCLDLDFRSKKIVFCCGKDAPQNTFFFSKLKSGQVERTRTYLAKSR